MIQAKKTVQSYATVGRSVVLEVIANRYNSRRPHTASKYGPAFPLHLIHHTDVIRPRRYTATLR
jgi:hypothetical protein